MTDPHTPSALEQRWQAEAAAEAAAAEAGHQVTDPPPTETPLAVGGSPDA